MFASRALALDLDSVGRHTRVPGSATILAVVIGAAVYIAFVLWLHPLLIGVPVLPARV